jgi:hypothetical protein
VPASSDAIAALTRQSLPLWYEDVREFEARAAHPRTHVVSMRAAARAAARAPTPNERHEHAQSQLREGGANAYKPLEKKPSRVVRT